MGRKPIVSVTYENEKIAINSFGPWTTQERRNTHFK